MCIECCWPASVACLAVPSATLFCRRTRTHRRIGASAQRRAAGRSMREGLASRPAVDLQPYQLAEGSPSHYLNEYRRPGSP
jgi:hypothetical protein